MTQMIVHDTLALLEPFFTSQERPKVIFARANQSLLSPDGLIVRLQQLMADGRRSGFHVMEAAQHDGYTALMGQQAWGLFNPTRSRELSAWAFDQYGQARILDQIQQHVTRFVDRIGASERFAALLPRIECFVLPGDPANRTFMISNHGLSCFGGVPGYLLVRVWPTPGNLERLAPVLARTVIHTARQAALESCALLTLGDWLVLEGLAAAFVEAVCAPLTTAPWLVSFAKPADWDDALAHVAQFYQLTSYDDLEVNVYGSLVRIGADRPPEARALDAEELEYAAAVVGDALDTTNATQIAAYLYGDEIVAAQGHPAVGLPAYAGFEVGYRLVQNYLKRTGERLIDVIGRPSQVILEHSRI